MRWVFVNAQGGIVAQSANAGVTFTKDNNRTLSIFDFNRDVSHCAAIATAEDSYTANAGHAQASVFPDRIIVELFDGYNFLGEPSLQTGGFSLAVYS